MRSVWDKDVVLWTDSADVQTATAEKLSGINLLRLQQLPQTNGKPIHGNTDVTSRALNIDTFVDLISLARADELILTLASPCQRIWPGRQGRYVTGFGTLAADLFERHDLLNQLLNSLMPC